MKTLIASLIALAGLAQAASAAQQAPVLVELFTSQGCHSCPPADEIIGELAERDDVMPLAFHVTYWDRLGWKDTFGDAIHTERQRSYARQMRSRSIYTPQMVIAGQFDAVGSDRQFIEKAIGIVREHGAARSLDISANGLVSLPNDLPAGTALWFAAYDNAEEVAIERGENAGETFTYHRIVRHYQSLGPIDGRAFVSLPLAQWREQGRSGGVIVAQEPETGAVLALGSLPL